MSQLKVGVILSYVLIFLNAITGIFITPFMLETLGQSQYGLYQLIGAFVGYMAILDFGLGNAIVRYVSEYRQQNDKKSESNFLAMTLIMYLVISIFAVIIGIILYSNLNNIFGKAFTSVELSQAKTMFIILIFNLAMSLPGNAFNAIINAYEKFAFNRGFTIFRIIFKMILLILLLKMGYGAIAIVVLDTAFNILAIFVNGYICKVYLKIKIKLIKFDKKLLREVFSYSIYMFINMILDQLIWRVAPTIIGIKMTTKDVAIFSVGMQFSSIFTLFSTGISGVFIPKVTRMVLDKEGNKVLTDFMIKVGRVQAIILCYIFTAFVVFGRKFIFLWIGDGYTKAWITALMVMTGLLIPLMENAGLAILQAMKKHQFYVITYLVICIFCIIATIFIVDYIGIVGASMMTMIGLILGHVVAINWYYYQKVGLDIPRFFKELFKGIFPISIISGIIMYFIVGYLSIDSWIMFIIDAGIFTLIYFISMWLFGINQYEKNMVMHTNKKIF